MLSMSPYEALNHMVGLGTMLIGFYTLENPIVDPLTGYEVPVWL